jgi:hypothetical protein
MDDCSKSELNMLRIVLVLVVLVALMLTAVDAHAYIGPGSGIGFLGSLWAWLVGFFVVVFAVLLWPLRWLLRRMRAGAASAKQPEGE